MGIVDELSRRGVRTWLVGDRVRAFPKALLTDEVKEIISDNREALVRELTAFDRGLPKPYLHRCGDLVIPFNSPKRYHWWAGGQSVGETIHEISQDDHAQVNADERTWREPEQETPGRH